MSRAGTKQEGEACDTRAGKGGRKGDTGSRVLETLSQLVLALFIFADVGLDTL